MKRRELLMLVASGGSVFAPPIADGGEHPFDGATDPDAAGSSETDSDKIDSMETGDNTPDPHEATPEADGDDSETIELTIELY